MGALLWIMLVALFLACASEAPPSVTILSPADGATACGTPLAVQLAVEDFMLVEPEAHAEGDSHDDHAAGHVDVSLNGEEVAMVATTDFVVEDVPEGEWQLKVALVGADHATVEPYAGDLVYLTVTADACAR